jgi:hypothetical protein
VCSSYLTIIIDEENGTLVVCNSETVKCEGLYRPVLSP